MANQSEYLSYPVGRFQMPEECSKNDIKQWTSIISSFPNKLENVLNDITAVEKTWRYRPGGWSLAQVVHHCADSHMNCLMRIKLTLTETKPSIKPYLEHQWSELPDGNELNLQHSIEILRGVHHKLGLLFTSFNDHQFKLSYHHPEHNSEFTLLEALVLYAWHCNHHLEHIKLCLMSKGKYNR